MENPPESSAVETVEVENHTIEEPSYEPVPVVVEGDLQPGVAEQELPNQEHDDEQLSELQLEHVSTNMTEVPVLAVVVDMVESNSGNHSRHAITFEMQQQQHEDEAAVETPSEAKVDKVVNKF